jgi:Fe2+ transport system protein FeoA
VTMNLWDAPFRCPLRVLDLSGLGTENHEASLVLTQLGVDIGETIEKLHSAPLKDPISILIGQQVFTLRSEICRRILVERL